MQLKDYQNGVLDDLSRYLRALTARREDAEQVFRILREKGREAKLADYCRETWDALHAEKALPVITDNDGNVTTPPYVARSDGLGRPVPNICLKVPTGGGKTLLGTVAVERINTEYFKKQTRSRLGSCSGSFPRTRSTARPGSPSLCAADPARSRGAHW